MATILPCPPVVNPGVSIGACKVACVTSGAGRITRVLELQQVSRLGRVYRLKGLLLKIWRALLLLETLQRLLGHYKEKRLRRLRELLAAREEEMGDLRREIADLEVQVAREKEAKRALCADGKNTGAGASGF